MRALPLMHEDGLRTLTSTLFSNRDRNRLLIMFQAYFDDSAIPGERPRTLSMACYVSSEESWDSFETEWRRDVLGPEGISCLRMTDLNNKRGEFTGWAPDRERGLLIRAHKVINRRTIRGVAVTVDVDAYARVMDSQAARFFGGSYGFCVFNCLLQLRHDMRRWMPRQFRFRHPVACVVEKGTDWGHEIVDVMRNISTHHPVSQDLQIIGYAFACKIDRPGLQAGDVIAYESNKHWYNQYFEARRKLDIRRSLLNLFRQRDFGYYYDELGLRKYMAALTLAQA